MAWGKARRTGTLAWLAFGWMVASAAAVACSPSPAEAPPVSDAGSDATSSSGCIAGQSIACAGPGGCSGYQVCNAGGTYDPCVCASAPDAAASGDGPAVLNGAIEKGPFVAGSTVAVSAVDGTASPTGQVYGTQTTDNLGDFTVSFAYRGNVDMTSTGFYYDEFTGGLSTAPIALRALTTVATGGPQNAYINLVTHLAHDRARVLMGDGGTSLATAEATAESQLVTALGIGGAGFSPGGAGSGMSVVGTNNDANAYLFAVSAVVMQLASTQSGPGSVDAKLQQVVDDIAADLANDGLLASTWPPLLRKAEQGLDVDLTMDQLSAYLTSLGSTAAPVDLNRAIDSDGDGYRNSVDTCPNVANTNQAVIPAGVVCKDIRHTTSTGATEGSVLLGDFEHNGQTGLLVGDIGTITYYVGDGAGRFPKHAGIVLPSGFVALATYDLNQDGNLDLLGGTSWLPGDGKGNFTPVTPYDTSIDGGGGPAYLAVYPGDVNGDGLIDIVRYCNVAGSPEFSCIAVSLATAKAVFAPAVVTVHTELTSTLQTLGPMMHTAIAPANLNGDAYMDFVGFGRATADAGAGVGVAVISYLGGPSGTFTEAALSNVPLSLIDSAGVLGDFDGDGHVDAAMWGCTTSCTDLTEVVVAYGNGDGTFGAMSTTALKSIPSSPLGVGDFNGDGKADLLAPSTLLTVLVSEGRSFGASQNLRIGALVGLGGFAVGDLNGDGIADVTVSSAGVAASTATLQAFVMDSAGAL